MYHLSNRPSRVIRVGARWRIAWELRMLHEGLITMLTTETLSDIQDGRPDLTNLKLRDHLVGCRQKFRKVLASIRQLEHGYPTLAAIHEKTPANLEQNSSQ